MISGLLIVFFSFLSGALGSYALHVFLKRKTYTQVYTNVSDDPIADLPYVLPSKKKRINAEENAIKLDVKRDLERSA